MVAGRPVVGAAVVALAIATATGPAAARHIAPLDSSSPISYWIAPAPTAADAELARWALGAWVRASGGAFEVREAASEGSALLRVYWVGDDAGKYGEMRPLRVGKRRGAAVYVMPMTDALGGAIAQRAARDPLFRDAIVYLTCVHELGHAFGLTHTAAFADIMYTFQRGGDIEEYFLRYRRQLRRRRDIRSRSGLSSRDRRRLRALYSRTR